MTNLSIYIRARQGDLSLLSEIDGFRWDDKNRCIALAAQCGQTQLLEQLISHHNIEDFAEHALWVAAHDLQFAAVDLLMPLVPVERDVWESVLRYAIRNNSMALQDTILAFDPLVNVNSCLSVAAHSKRKPLMETLLERSTHLTATVVLQMMDNTWNDLVENYVHTLLSEEKNRLFVQCVEQQRPEQDAMFEVCKNDLKHSTPNALAAAIFRKNWNLAEQLVPYCDVPAAVKIVNAKNPNTKTRTQLQRLVLLNEVEKFDHASSSKRKI